MKILQHSPQGNRYSRPRKSLIIAAFSLLIANPLLVRASDGGSAATPSASPGSVEKSQLSQSAIALKDMRDVLRRLHRAALDLISEVEQRDMVVVGQPELIQPIPSKGDPHPGTMEEMITLGDALPPRKKWLDITMSEIEKMVALLKQERAAIEIQPDKQTAAAAPLKELDDLLTNIDSQVNQLKTLTAGPKYENIAIGKQGLAIFEETRKVEKPWKELVQLFKK